MAPTIEVTGGDSSTVGEVVTIPVSEFNDLQSRASASSQNFERLKKATESNEQYLARIAELESGNAPTGTEATDAKVAELETTVKGLTDNLAMGKVLEAYPVIKGKEEDFETFRLLPENQGLSIAVAAKAFVLEKDLITPRRPGLETPTGGGHVPVASGKLSAEDANKLRTTNYRAYTEALKAGRIEIE